MKLAAQGGLDATVQVPKPVQNPTHTTLLDTFRAAR
jgi:hypothetical protein